MLEYEMNYILMAKLFPQHSGNPTALYSTQDHISLDVVLNLLFGLASLVGQ